MPRDAAFGTSEMTAFPVLDRLAVLRDALSTVMSLGLDAEVPDNVDLSVA